MAGRTHAYAVYLSGRRVPGTLTASRNQALGWARGLRDTYMDEPRSRRPAIRVRSIRIRGGDL